jgi:hypothetical protein
LSRRPPRSRCLFAALSIIRDYTRRGLVRLELGAHLLDLRCLLFQTRIDWFECRFQFLYVAALFEELVCSIARLPDERHISSVNNKRGDIVDTDRVCAGHLDVHHVGTIVVHDVQSRAYQTSVTLPALVPVLPLWTRSASTLAPWISTRWLESMYTMWIPVP